jgi:AhpD family alkylhydroperoxidase
MTRIAAPEKQLMERCEPFMKQAEASMGYQPNDVLSLCHWPELLHSLSGLVHTVLQTGEIDPTLKRLIGIISSRTQGCTYCTAHSTYGASQLGVDARENSGSL